MFRMTLASMVRLLFVFAIMLMFAADASARCGKRGGLFGRKNNCSAAQQNYTTAFGSGCSSCGR